MSHPLKEHRLPLAVSVAALGLAIFIGLIPVMQKDDPPTQVTVGVELPDLSVIEDRLAALEAAPQPATLPEIPPNADNARLRQEIDLINKALGNQTGRVSRLKAQVANVIGENGKVAVPSLVVDEISLAKKGLVNLTRRINQIEDRLDLLTTAHSDIVRLQQQMKNVDLAFLSLKRAANQSKAEREDINAKLASLIDDNVSFDSPTRDSVSNLNDIHSKLDQILTRMAE